MCLALHVNMLGNQETVRMYIPSYLYYLNGSKPRTHSFEAVWWSSCLRFKRCTMVPNSSCRHLADFDDDTFAKTWLHDVNTTPMIGKDTQSFIRMLVSARHAEKRLSLGSLFELDLLKK